MRSEAGIDLPSLQSIGEPGARFCKKCGTAIGSAKADTSPTISSTKSQIRVAVDGGVSEAIDGERKTVTALFADIKGSTELMRDLDPEEARAIVDPVLQLMMAAVHRYGGYVAQSTGDGIFALFGAPLAHEDHPQRALHAALAMQEDLHRYADRLCAEGKIPVEARVGVNTGEVVVRTIETGGHTEYTPVGHVTNLAARMQTAAPAGSIAASEATQRLCEGYFEFRGAGADGDKGTQRPGRGVRGSARRAAADALPARGAARADPVRRARARDGGDGRRAGAGQGGPRADRCGSWRGGCGQIAPHVRVQSHYPGRMQSAGSVPDQHDLAFDPANAQHLFSSNDGGVYTSMDGQVWTSLNDDLQITGFQSISSSPLTARVIGGTQDNGTEMWSGSRVWQHIDDGDSASTVMDLSDPNQMYDVYVHQCPRSGGGSLGSFSLILNGLGVTQSNCYGDFIYPGLLSVPCSRPASAPHPLHGHS